MSAGKQHAFETTFINSWVEFGVYHLKVNTTVAEQMRRHRLNLLDINVVLRTGRVVSSDMLGCQGLWTVRGYTADSARVDVVITVKSTYGEVELLRIAMVQRR